MSYFVLPRRLFTTYIFILSRLIASVGEGRADFAAVVYTQFCCFCLKEFPLPLGACAN